MELTKFIEEDFTLSSSLVEEIDSKGIKKKFLVGKVQSTLENQNHREYDEELWDDLHESERFITKLKKGVLVGGVGHPPNGVFDPEKSASTVRKHWREGKDVYAKREILKTPSGNVLCTLIESGVKLCPSSRGKGDSIEKDGKVKVKKGFDLEGYDDVIDPSVKDTFSDLITESIDNPGYILKDNIRKRLLSPDITEMESVQYKMICEEIYGTSKVYTSLMESIEQSKIENSKSSLKIARDIISAFNDIGKKIKKLNLESSDHKILNDLIECKTDESLSVIADANASNLSQLYNILNTLNKNIIEHHENIKSNIIIESVEWKKKLSLESNGDIKFEEKDNKIYAFKKSSSLKLGYYDKEKNSYVVENIVKEKLNDNMVSLEEQVAQQNKDIIQLNAKLSESASKYEELSKRYIASKKLVSEFKESYDELKSKTSDHDDDYKTLEQRLDAAKKLIAESLNIKAELESDNQEESKRLGAAKQIIEEFQKRFGAAKKLIEAYVNKDAKGNINDYIESVLNSFPKLDRSSAKDLLSICESKEDVDQKAKSLLKLSNVAYDHTLPFRENLKNNSSNFNESRNDKNRKDIYEELDPLVRSIAMEQTSN